jgi:hypothetical protein
MSAAIFTGSYHADDVQILLKVIDVPDTSVEEKERRIQQEQRPIPNNRNGIMTDLTLKILT